MIVQLTQLACLSLAGLGATSDTPEGERDLSIRLEPGQVWRQQVDCRTDLVLDDGSRHAWNFDCTLRLRVAEVNDEVYEIEGAFIDWRLAWEEGPQSMEWNNGRFRVDGELSGEEPGTDSCRRLWRCWSESLRKVDLRFSLTKDGQMLDLRGMETMWEPVSRAVEGCTDAPEGFVRLFGKEGLERAQAVLAFALSVPRPGEPVSVGASWADEPWLPDMNGRDGLLRRNFRLTGFTRERRHRLGVLELSPTLAEAESLMSAPASYSRAGKDGRVELLLDNGLLYRMSVELHDLARTVDGPFTSARYRIDTRLED